MSSPELPVLAALVSLAGQRGELMADLLGSDSAEFDARLRLLTDADPGSRASDEWQDRLDALLEWLLAGPASRLVRAVVGRAFEVSERLRSDPVIQDDSTADGPSQLAGTDDLGAKVSARSRSRVVNLALTEDGRILRPEEPLRAGQRAALRYDIGTRADHSLVPAGSAPLPEEALPSSEAGHWLEVVVDAVGVDDPAQRFSIYLPLTGPAWQCDCESDAHHCRREDRRPYAEVPFTVQAGTARVVLRVGTYFGANLLQLHVVIADVDDLVRPVATEDTGSVDVVALKSLPRQRAEVAYSLHPRLSAPEKLPERDVSIATSIDRRAGETHRLMIHGRTGDTVTFGLAESQARNAVMAARQVLRTVHFVEERGKLRNLLDASNAKSPQAFLADLRRLAQVGWMLWTALFADKLDTVDTIRSSLLASRRLQICMAGSVDLVFPWAMIYDIPLFGGPDEQRPCRLVEEWTGSSPMVAHDTADCPFADTHGQNVLCPYGFWGMRHVIEQPPSVPDGSSLSLEIALLAEPGKVLAGFSPALNDSLTQAHIDAIVTALGTRLQLAPCFTIATLRDALAAPELPLAYLYCHGVRSSLAGTTGSIPELVLDKDSSLRPQDLIGLRMSVWPSDHWRVVRPLVFINGCHTAELTPEELVSFVGAFVNVGAAGVVGTEITLHQSVAGEAAEAFLTAFASGADVGSAMSALRRQLLGKGNLLGLAYTPYCSSGLSLRSLVSDSVEGGEGA